MSNTAVSYKKQELLIPFRELLCSLPAFFRFCSSFLVCCVFLFCLFSICGFCLILHVSCSPLRISLTLTYKQEIIWVIPVTRRVHSIWYLRFYYFPLLIYRGMVDLTKQHYVSHGRDPMSWIFDDMINTGDLLFRPTAASCLS